MFSPYKSFTIYDYPIFALPSPPSKRNHNSNSLVAAFFPFKKNIASKQDLEDVFEVVLTSITMESKSCCLKSMEPNVKLMR